MVFRLRALALPALALALCAGPVQAAESKCKLNQLVELPVTMQGTAPVVTVGIDGQPARFTIDSGAFYSIMTPAAAKRFNYKPLALQQQAKGVGGRADLGMVTVKTFNLSPAAALPHVAFLVSPMAGGGVDGVLGENVLGLADVEYDLANGVVRILKPEGCSGVNLGYWAKGEAAELTLSHSAKFLSDSSDRGRMVQAHATLNGQRIEITFDTGASRSLLSLHAAARAGVTPKTPGVVPGGMSGGFGPRAIATWVAPVQSFAVGSEEIKNTSMRFGDTELGDTDMLLGADFFLSHRIYVANSQAKMYLTYNGGPVFKLDNTDIEAQRAAVLAQAQAEAGVPQAPAVEGAARAAGPTDINIPTDADGFIRRASGFTARRDYVHAVEDLTKAVALDPKNAQAYMERARARLALRQTVLAMADLDDTLKLKPDSKDALLARGAILAGGKDYARARADLDAGAALDTTDGQARLQVAAIYERAELYEDAIRQYDLWLADNAKSAYAPAAYNGACYDRAILKKDLDKALADCNAALRTAPRSPAILDSRALTHLDRGEYDLAITDYDAALKLQTKPTPIFLFGRGVAKQRKGDKAGGDADIAAAVALNPKVADNARRIGLVAEASPGTTAPRVGAGGTSP